MVLGAWGTVPIHTARGTCTLHLHLAPRPPNCTAQRRCRQIAVALEFAPFPLLDLADRGPE